MKAPIKLFNVLNLPVLRLAGLGFVFLLCCAAALAWFAPPQSAFAFLTGGENPQSNQIAVLPADKFDMGKLTKPAPRAKGEGEENSQDGVWREVRLDSLSGGIGEGVPETARALELNSRALKKILNSAPDDLSERLADLSESRSILQLPLPDGGFMRFRLADSPVLETSLVEQFPEIKSYRAQSIDDLRVSARISFSPLGLHATILTHDKMISIHPARYDDVKSYVVYYGEDSKGAPFSCGVTESIERRSKAVDLIMEDAAARNIPTGATLRTYRFAVATTEEYYKAAKLGNNSYNNTVASINAWVSAVNLIYERELAVRLLAFTKPEIVFTGTVDDKLTNGNGGAMHVEIQDILVREIGLTNFDIGHVFGTGGGGVAVIGATCSVDKAKGGGATNFSESLEIGDASSLKVLAHEIGHQFGAPHTWNACAGTGGRSNTSSYEVGSGSTIMGYGGVCRADQNLPASDNLLGANDMRFHAISLKNINDHLNSANQCAITQNTGNAAPVVDAGAGYTIPTLTPFALTASATDADGDVKNLTYTWEQFDAGGTLYPNPPYGDQPIDPETTTRPIFRAYSPTSNSTRIFPSLTYILNNANNPPQTVRVGTEDQQVGEKLPSVARKMKFRVTARDNRSGGGGTNDDDLILTVAGNAGPFAVSAPNTSVVWTGGTTKTVTWDVNNTNLAPVSAANVKISLSSDGGQTFPVVLAASVPNNGSASVNVPSGIQTAAARVKIEAVGNIFFDISDANFTINTGDTCPIIYGIAPGAGSVGTEVVINGLNLNGVTAVIFNGGVTAPILTGSRTATEIKVNVPAGAMSGAITLKSACSDRQTAPFSVCASSPQPLTVDDGTREGDYSDKYHVNRIKPTSYPATLTHVQIYFHSGGNNATVGEEFTILAGTNADGDTNINNTAFQSLTASVKTVGNYNSYELPVPITITEGDFVIGYKLTMGRAGSADNTAPQSRSYYSNGDTTGFGLTNGTNYMIRGQYSTGCAVPTAISPAAQEFNASAGNGSIAVTASTFWTATSSVPWITINPGASGTNSGTVVYAVKQNDTGATRTGTITVAGQTFTVTQTACAIGFTPSPNTTSGAAGGAFDISVFAPAGCSWTATSNTNWITINSGTSGINNGTITYTAAANIEKTARTGTITIAGQILTVTQTACPDSATMIFDDDVDSLRRGGTYFVSRLTPTSYPATLTHAQIYLHDTFPDNVNITVLAGKNTDGDTNINGSIQQTFTANTGTGRAAYKTFALPTPITISSGDFVVGFKIASGIIEFPVAVDTLAPIYGRAYSSSDNGATFQNYQNEDFKIRGVYKSFCPDGTISPASRSVSGSGASGAVSVTASGAWSAHSNDAWITINSGTSGTGNGTVNYTVAQNTTGAVRTGTVTIAGQVFTVTQGACFITFAPGNSTVGSGGGSFTASVPAGCGAWTATSNKDWITVTSGASGTGSGTVGYKVAVNRATTGRTGTITIAGQTLTVTQNACGDLTTMKLDDDDGGGFSTSGVYFVNRLTPTSYPATLTHVQINFSGDTRAPNGIQYGVPLNQTVTIVAGKNEDGDATINGSIQQTFDRSSGTIRDAYTTFALPTPITISKGDFVVGFKIEPDKSVFPLKVEAITPFQSRGYRSYDNGQTFVLNPNQEDFRIRGQYQLTCSDSTVRAISPPSFNNSGGSGTVSVSGTGNLTATSNDPWITVTNGGNSANGDANYLVTSNGVVSYTIAPNDTGEPRTGSITVDGQIFYIFQAGSGRTIAGTVRYGIDNTKTVFDVILAATGGSDFSTETSLSGAYLLPGLVEEENYTVTPIKTTDVNGINSLDATRIQQHLVGLITLTPNQLIAADTDGNGTVNSLDATRIQQKMVGITAQNIIGQWKFVPGSKQYDSVNRDLAGENYEAVLVGEVSGNWSPTDGAAAAFSQEAEPQEELTAAEVSGGEQAESNERLETELAPRIAGLMKQSAEEQSVVESAESAVMGASVAVSLPSNAVALSGNTIVIPVSIGAIPAGSSIEAFDFSVFYDPAILSPLSPPVSNTGTLSANCSVLSNTLSAGRVAVSGSCAQALTTGSGTLVNLRFSVIGAGNQQTSLSFTNPMGAVNTFQFNNGTPAAVTTNGQFTVTGPTAASVSISGRVLTTSGRAIGNVQITLTDAAGNERTAMTSSFGYYRFEGVAAGETITLTAKARRFRFNQSSIVRTTIESIMDADFISEQ